MKGKSKRWKWAAFFACLGAIVFIFAKSPATSKLEGGLINNPQENSGKDQISEGKKQQDDNNNFLFGNWKLKGEEEDRINILLLGIGGEGHEAGYLTDTIILASFSPSKNKLGLLSIPRDLFIKQPDKNYYTRINAVKYRAEQEGKNGIAVLEKSIADITSISPDYHVVFDFSKFEELIDKLGGIDITLDEPVYDPLFPKGESQGYKEFYIEAGTHHLDGKTALMIARSRHSAWGDFDRALRQQKVIQAIWEKAKENPEGKIEGLVKLFNLWDYFRNNIETDFGILEAKRMLDIFQKTENLAIINKVLTSKMDGELLNARVKFSDGIGLVLTPKDESWEEIREIAKDILE